jgi:hypothetical protein
LLGRLSTTPATPPPQHSSSFKWLFTILFSASYNSLHLLNQVTNTNQTTAGMSSETKAFQSVLQTERQLLHFQPKVTSPKMKTWFSLSDSTFSNLPWKNSVIGSTLLLEAILLQN